MANPAGTKRKRTKLWTARLWYRVYRERISAGLERCRNCAAPDTPTNWLTFDHVVAHSKGRNLTFDNATILCEGCNGHKADADWPHLRSLAYEEDVAAPGQRWFAIAALASFRAADDGNFCRRGLDGAEVSIYSSDLHGLRCIACALAHEEHVAFGDGYDRLIAHLTEHRAAGWHVPAWVDDDLRGAQARAAEPHT